MANGITRRELAGAAAWAFWITGEGRAEPLPRNVLLTGRAAEGPAAVPLRAGPVTAIFEPGIAFLRYIRYDDREILRGLYAAVRDKVWGTVAPRVSNVVTETRADSFRLTFDVDNVDGEIDFGWQGVITGNPQGTIRFEFNGRARSSFLKNRLGFAVLHPIKECSGKACTIEKAGGLKEPGVFPGSIAPHQPFKDLAAISHEVLPGLTAEVRFEGDLFETEDHRNWTDANFKTYCTPLDRPFPVEVRRGQEVRQAVTVKLIGLGSERPSSSAAPRGLSITPAAATGRPVKLPAIGLGFAADRPALTSTEALRIRALHPAHLRVELKLSEPGWEKALGQASRLAPLEAALFLSDNAGPELQSLAAKAPARVARWLVFSEKSAALARQHLRNAPVIVGTNEYFTELNRERPQVKVLDGSCYSVNPQVHAFDNQSLVENLEGQGHTVKSAQRFLEGKPVHVTPVTLRPRFNPQAKGAPEPIVPGRLPSRIDARQMSLFGAVWTLGSIKYLAESGAASITYFQTHGWAGVMEAAAGSPAPELFPSIPGAVFPLYHVLADVNEFAGGTLHPLDSSDPLQTCALLLELAARRRLLVANLTSQPKLVMVDASRLGPRARVSSLDEQTAEAAMREPERFRARLGSLLEPATGGQYRLAMLPYSVVRLDRA